MNGADDWSSAADVRAVTSRWAAGRIDDDEATSELLDALEARDAVVRTKALHSLTEFYEETDLKAVEIVDKIAAAAAAGKRVLVSQGDDLRSLYRDDPTAITPLLEHFRQVLGGGDVPAETNVYFTCGVVGDVGSIAPGVVKGLLPTLVGAIGADDSSVRWHATCSLARIGRTEPAVVRSVVAGRIWTLDADSPQPIATACVELGYVGIALPDLVPVTAEFAALRDHHDPDVRTAFAEAIGRIGGLERDDDGWYGVAALEAVADHYDDLAALAADPDADVRAAAVSAIRRLCAADPSLVGRFQMELRDAIDDANSVSTEAIHAVRAAIEAGEPCPWAIDPLRRALAADTRCRVVAARALCWVAIRDGFGSRADARHALALACWALLNRRLQPSRIDDPAIARLAEAVDELGLERDYLSWLLEIDGDLRSSTKRTIALLIARISAETAADADRVCSRLEMAVTSSSSNERKVGLLGLRFIAGTNEAFDRRVPTVVEDYLESERETARDVAADAVVAATEQAPLEALSVLRLCCRQVTSEDDGSTVGPAETLESIGTRRPAAAADLRTELFDLVAKGGEGGRAAAAVLSTAIAADELALTPSECGRLRTALESAEGSWQFQGAVATCLLRADTDQETATLARRRAIQAFRSGSWSGTADEPLLAEDRELALAMAGILPHNHPTSGKPYYVPAATHLDCAAKSVVALDRIVTKIGGHAVDRSAIDLLAEFGDQHPHALSSTIGSPDEIMMYSESNAIVKWISLARSSSFGFDNQEGVVASHPDPTVRDAAAAGGLSDPSPLPDPEAVTDPEAIDDLAADLASTTVDRERAARRRLVAVATSNPEHRERVVLNLLLRVTALDRGTRRDETVDALASLADQPVSPSTSLADVLVAYLDSKSTRLRRQAITVATALAPALAADGLSGDLEVAIVDRLRDDDAIVREWAAFAARRYSRSLATSDRVVPRLIDLLTDRFPVAQTATYALSLLARTAPDRVAADLDGTTVSAMRPSLQDGLISTLRNLASADPAYAELALDLLPADELVGTSGQAVFELLGYAPIDQVATQPSILNWLVDRLEATSNVDEAHAIGHLLVRSARARPEAVWQALKSIAAALESERVAVIHAEDAVYRTLAVLVAESGSNVAGPFAEPIASILDVDGSSYGTESSTQESGTVNLSHRALRGSAARVAGLAGLDCYATAVDSFPSTTDAPALNPTVTARFLVTGSDDAVTAVRDRLRDHYPREFVAATVRELARLELAERWRRQARLDSFVALLPVVDAPPVRRRALDVILDSVEAPNWTTRSRAVETLGSLADSAVIQPDEVISHLLPAVTSDHEQVWTAVRNILIAACGRAKLTPTSLVRLLRSWCGRAADGYGIEPIVADLGRRHLCARPAAVGVLADLVDHEAVAVRKRALQGLTAIAAVDPAAIATVVDAAEDRLDDADPNVQAYAEECLATAGTNGQPQE